MSLKIKMNTKNQAKHKILTKGTLLLTSFCTEF